MKYKNKDTNEIVKVFQYNGDIKDRNGKYYIPDWAIDAFIDGRLHYIKDELYLKSHIVNVGDYLVERCSDIFVSSQKYFEENYVLLGSSDGFPSIDADVELVGDEEIPCCVVDIMTAEKLIPLLTGLVEEKDEEIKSLRLELEKVKNSLKNSDIPKGCDPRTMLEKTDHPIEKLYDSDFGLHYCPTCKANVKEDAVICPICSQEFVKTDVLKQKINDIRSELLKHGELYKGFLVSIRSAIKQYDKDRLEEMRNLTFLPVGFQNDASMRSVPEIEYYILNFLIGDFYCPNCFEPVKRNEEK